MNRRSLLIAPLVLGIGACATFDKDLRLVATDAALIASGVEAIASQMSKIISPSTAAVITKIAVGVRAVAVSLASASSKAEALPLVQKIEAYVHALLDALSGLPLPPPLPTVLLAIQIILPIIEALVGMVVPPMARAMTPDQARAVLAAAR